jgi:hypothetical protein
LLGTFESAKEDWKSQQLNDLKGILARFLASEKQCGMYMCHALFLSLYALSLTLFYHTRSK